MVVQPKPIDDLLANPGMGWQTFHRFAGEDKNLQGLPSASAYFRFYWREIEPKENQVDFAMFDDLLSRARHNSQKLAFRVMCTGSGQYMDVPAWLKENGCRGVEFRYGNRPHWIPDFADPLFLKAHLRLIRQLGERYNGHPDLDLVDIGSVGLWGEWHMSDTIADGSKQPVPMPPVEIQNQLISAWRDAFSLSSKVVLIGCDQGMERAEAEGLGWRADCLGDCGGFSKTWNHMDNYYLQQIEKRRAQNAWKLAPIAFESCWDMRKWKQEGWNIPWIFDYALRCHASYLNNKSAPIPEGTRSDIEAFLRRLGYRLVLRRFEHESQVQPGSSLPMTLQWENTGVAPPYRNDTVAFRLTSKIVSNSKPLVIVTGPSIRGWMPGVLTNQCSVEIPASLEPGAYQLSLGIVDHATQQPSVRLAIAGGDAEGWYPLSQIEIVRSSR